MTEQYLYWNFFRRWLQCIVTKLWNEKFRDCFLRQNLLFLGLWSEYDSGSCELNNSVHLFANITCYFWTPGKTLDLNAGIEIFKIILCPLKNNLSFSEWVTNKVYTFPSLLISFKQENDTTLFILSVLRTQVKFLICWITVRQYQD